MSDEWAVGDLALCVNVGPIDFGQYVGVAGERLKLGATYTVRRVTVQSMEGDTQLAPYLWLCGVSGSAAHERFRKVKPDTHESCEEEFRILLQLSKKRVKA